VTPAPPPEEEDGDEVFGPPPVPPEIVPAPPEEEDSNEPPPPLGDGDGATDEGARTDASANERDATDAQQPGEGDEEQAAADVPEQGKPPNE
jgi:hypothetical protein